MDSAALTQTTTLLLDSLRDPEEQAAWAEFDGRYRPILKGFLHSIGLHDADADDVAQQTMAEFVRSYRDGKYDRTRGRLSSWLIGIAHRQASAARRAGAKHRHDRGVSAIDDLADVGRLTAIWEAEHKRAVYARAVEVLRGSSRVEERTFRAFELAMQTGMTAEAVARECGISVDEVYVARSRVAKRLREIVAELSAAYQEEE